MSDDNLEYADTLKVIREVVLEFIKKMLGERNELEQIIREKTEDIKQKFVGQGQSTYSYADINRLTSSFKEFYINFYKNTIHLRIIKESSHAIRNGIYNGFSQLDIISQDIIDDLESLKEQSQETATSISNQKQIVDDLNLKAENLEQENKTLKQELNLTKTEYESLQEKSSDIGPERIELDAQIKDISEELVESKREKTEFQVAIRERDAKILKLKSESAGKEEIEKEVTSLRDQIHEMNIREKNLMANQSASTEEFVNKLQQDLEKTREELYEKKSQEVKQKEEIRSIKLNYDENKLELNHLKTSEEQSRKFSDSLETKNESITIELKQAQDENLILKEKKEINAKELSTLTSKLEETAKKLQLAEEHVGEFSEKISVGEGAVDAFEKSISYFKTLISRDPKFRALTIIESLNSEILLKDLSISLGIPIEITLKYVIELSDLSLITTRRKGQLLYVKAMEKSQSPFSLKSFIKIDV